MAEREVSVVKVLAIPDNLCKAAGCKAVWGYGNQLFVTAGCRKPFRDEPSGTDVEAGAVIHEVLWNTNMHLPMMRKLVNETCCIFAKIQQQMDASHTAMAKKSLILKYSREYRSVIKACIVDINRQLASSSGRLYEQLEMLEMSELLWSLCEILLIDIAPGGVLLKHLLDWWQLRFVEYDRKAYAAMKSDSPEMHPHYWDAVYNYVLQGRLDNARQMLSLHSQTSTLYRMMDRLLGTMPVYSLFAGQSLSEFDVRWSKWHKECQCHLDDCTFVTDSNLLMLCRILAGDDAVFAELRHILGTWYCTLISVLLYTNPSVQATDLQYHAHACIDVFGGMSHITPWDSILLSALEMDIHQVIRQCSSEFRNWWLVSHLTDLLHHQGILEPQIHNFGGTLREFLILEYASSLISHHSLWQVGFVYLEYCPVFGKHFLAEYIERLPVETEQKAHKLLQVCEKNGLHSQSRSICKTMAVRALYAGRLGSALHWGIGSKDAGFVSHVAERYLMEYSSSGRFLNLDLIDNLGSTMLMTSELTFLGKYREFHKLYNNRQFTEAGALLLSLLTARVAPKRFWSMLLLDAIPLLEAETTIFNTQQTCELLHCLEELQMSQRLESNKSSDASEHMEVESSEREREKTSLLRLALTRNLARAIMVDAVS